MDRVNKTRTKSKNEEILGREKKKKRSNDHVNSNLDAALRGKMYNNNYNIYCEYSTKSFALVSLSVLVPLTYNFRCEKQPLSI